MSKVTMPEPVGKLHRGLNDLIYFTPNGDPHIKDGMAVIATDQAEAYAAARVREALEEAAKAAESCVCSCCCSDDQKFTAQDAAQRIRALIPSTPA